MSKAFEFNVQIDTSRFERRFNAAKIELFKKRLLEIMVAEIDEAVIISKFILAPIGETERLSDSIDIHEIEVTEDRISILAGTSGVPYAAYVEFGTSKMHARPYWRPPAWEALYRINDQARKLFMEIFGE